MKDISYRCKSASLFRLLLSGIISLFLLFLIATAAFAGNGSGMVVFHLGGGASSFDGTAMSGPDVGFYFFSDATLLHNPEMKPGEAYNAGFDFIYFFENLALLSGIIYEWKRFSLVYPKRTATTDLKYKTSAEFLTIPLGLRYYWNIFYFGGGYFHGLAICKGEIEVEGTYSVTYHEDLNDDYGIFFDAGINYPLFDTLGLDVYMRYEHGMSEIFHRNDIMMDIRTRALYLNMGISYYL